MSQQKVRKDMRRREDKAPQPVTQHDGSGSKPKPTTSGTAKPASTWFK